MKEIPSSIENIIYEIMDQFKFIFFPEQWNQFFVDYSKNEIFIMLLTYRRHKVNMTEISEYMNIPLNTVTGVVNRLEKKAFILRERSKEDKRVVTIQMTEQGKQFLSNEISTISHYFYQVMDVLSEEEKTVLIGIAEKVFHTLQKVSSKEIQDKDSRPHVKRIRIE